MTTTVKQLDENSARADQPVGTKVQMKPHQLALLRACREFEVNGVDSNEDYIRSRIGVIGDKVGSGKSYVILSLIMSDIPASLMSDRDVLNFAENTVQICRKHKQRLVKSSLLVIPHGLSRQWQEYVNDFLPEGFKTLFVGRSRALDAITDIDEYDLIITTNTFYTSLARLSDGVRWKRVVFDEVDSVKIQNCTFINSCTYWFVTASYNNVIYPMGHTVLNRSTQKYVQMANGLRMSGFVRALFQELRDQLEPPHSISSLIIKNIDSFVDSSASLSPLVENVIKCSQSRIICILNGLVDTEIIRHLNADDLKGALAFISSNRKQSESNIVSCLIESYERKARNIAVKIEYHKMLDYEDETARDSIVTRLEASHEQVLKSIEAIKIRVIDSSYCPICYEDVVEGKKSIVPCCQNVFCFKCIARWLGTEKNCPMCKAPTALKDVFVVEESQKIREVPENVIKNKADTLSDLMGTMTEGKKVIIFSAFDSTFDVIEPILRSKALEFERLQGTGAHIALVTKRYKERDLNVLLANADNFGSGMNLENTTDIIMFHKFDTEIERQVIGRAQRPGRTCPLRVWYLLNENEC